jgi:hypothetical protein
VCEEERLPTYFWSVDASAEQVQVLRWIHRVMISILLTERGEGGEVVDE